MIIFLSSIVSIVTFGRICGSQLEKIAFVIVSFAFKTSPSMPHNSHLPSFSSTPNIIFPPNPLAKATTVLIYFLCSEGISFLNSIFFVSPLFNKDFKFIFFTFL